MSKGWEASTNARDNAARRLPEIAAEYFEAGAALWASGKTAEELHRFRLQTKHFRYTLELFEEQYGAPFNELMVRLKPLQDALGEINDAATALAWLAADEPAVVRGYLQRRIERKSAAFERYWKTDFGKAGEQARWEKVLGTPK